MIVWCCYCQDYIGEKDPIEDYSFSHGCCESCVPAMTSNIPTERSEKNRQLKDIFDRYLDDVYEGKPIDINCFISHSLTTGFGALELFYLTVQPVLVEIGLAFARGEVTYQQEHLFSKFAMQILEKISSEMTSVSNGPSLELVCVDHNFHSIGVKALALKLRSLNFNCQIHGPSTPTNQILDIAENGQVAVLGLSIATSKQVEELPHMIEKIRNKRSDLNILIGGPAINDTKDLYGADFVHDKKNFSKTTNYLRNILKTNSKEKKTS